MCNLINIHTYIHTATTNKQNWSDWEDRQYGGMLVPGTKQQKENRESCTTVTVLKYIICGMHT